MTTKTIPRNKSRGREAANEKRSVVTIPADLHAELKIAVAYMPGVRLGAFVADAIRSHLKRTQDRRERRRAVSPYASAEARA